MNEWKQLQADNELRQQVEINRRIESAKAEIRVTHKVTKLIITLTISAIAVLLIIVFS